MPYEIDPDPFDDLLSLEDEFYKEGYQLGIIDGDREGLNKGRLFGLKQGFEKFAVMGKLHGRAMVWTGRLPSSNIGINVDNEEMGEQNPMKPSEEPSMSGREVGDTSCQKVPDLPKSARLENHVRTLYALTESVSLLTENSEEAMQDFEDRFHQAEAKVRIIEKLAGESSPNAGAGNPFAKRHRSQPHDRVNKIGSGDIEDVSVLHVRH